MCVIMNKGEWGRSLTLQMKRKAIYGNVKKYMFGKQMFDGSHKNNEAQKGIFYIPPGLPHISRIIMSLPVLIALLLEELACKKVVL